jgi:hypothetical protein
MISLCTSAIYELFNAGKLHIIFFFLSLYLFFIKGSIKKVVFQLIVAFIVVLFLLKPLDNLFLFFQDNSIQLSGSSNNVIANSISEFTFPYSNILYVESFVNWGRIRYGIDFIGWLINCLPASILNSIGLNEIMPSHIFNTYNYTGGAWTAGMPTDIITLGYYQFRELGIVLMCGFWGIIACIFDIRIRKVLITRSTNVLVMRALMFFFLLVPYADPDPLLRLRLDYSFFILIIIYLTKSHRMVISDSLNAIGLENLD